MPEHPSTQSDEVIVELHADPETNHIDVANQTMAQLSIDGKYRISSPNEQGTFFVHIPHASDEVREALRHLGITIVDRDARSNHVPVPTCALPAFNRKLAQASAETQTTS